METRAITVTGKGSVTLTPDVTRISLIIKGLRQTYNDTFELASQNNAVLKRCMANLKINENELKTTHFDIEKQFKSKKDRNGNWEEFFVGFKLDQHLKVDIGIDNKLLGNLVKEIGLHVPDVEIEIGYTVKDPRPAELRMVEKAVKDAKEKAEVMAKAANSELGNVISITYAWSELSIYTKTRNIHNCEEALCEPNTSLDITPDDLGASDNVTVVWELK